MKRRNFLAGIGTGILTTSTASFLKAGGASAVPQTPRQQRPMMLDAMGEIRLTHPMNLVKEVLASGTNAVMVTITDPKEFGETALDLALADLLAYDRHIKDNSAFLLKATAVSDIDRARKEGKLALFYMLQNMTPLMRDVRRVDLLYSLGVRALQLTYNEQNYVGSGCRERGQNGLSNFGLEVIARLNELGVLLDTSHANMTTMAEAIAASKKPTIISHTACMSLYQHVRNTTDENIRTTAEKGGLIGICQLRPFLTEKKADNLSFFFDHIDHAVKVAGIDHVCLGSDRDHRIIEDSPEEQAVLLKEEGPQFQTNDWPLYFREMNGPRRMEVVWDGLKKRNYPEANVEKIMGGNLYRLYREVIG